MEKEGKYCFNCLELRKNILGYSSPFSQVPANCLKMTLAFSFSTDIILIYCCEGSPWCLIYFCHWSVCLIQSIPLSTWNIWHAIEATFLGEKDLEPVPRSALKCDTGADSELKEGDENGMRWKGVAPVGFFFPRCERKRFIPVPRTTRAQPKCLVRWHVAEEMVHSSTCVSLLGAKKKKKRKQPPVSRLFFFFFWREERSEHSR